MRFSTALPGLSLAISMLPSLMGQSAAPEHAAGIDAIWAYAGTWKIATEHFDTANSKASHETSTLRNDCWKSAGYVVCNQFVDGESKVLLVFTYNPKDNTYTSYPILQGGGPAGSGTLLIEGNVWTFPWQTSEAGKITYFRVVNVFPAPGRIEFRQEFSSDKTHWTLMAKGLETKTGDSK